MFLASLQAICRAIRESSSAAQFMLGNMMYQEANEDEKRGVPGLQQLVLKREPAGDWNETTDRLLPLFFEGREWSALFYDVLGCPTAHPFIPNDKLEEWKQRQIIKFQAAIPDYPMLGRIWDTYIDVTDEPYEVNQLRDECLKVKATTTNAIARRGLDKLLHACDDAVKYSFGSTAGKPLIDIGDG